ncbi:hypothetical protein AB0I10_39780 [Streptomyces sp. NPDC050636]|uniref:hypothetical protein n=1 Tax=Streptomyces sp. NPDC050636 TaxID=3154510 RepID=UPI003422F37D
MPRKKWWSLRGKRNAVITLIVVAIAAGAVLLATALPPGPRPDTVPHELMRVSVQVLGVVVIGVFVTMATFGLQQVQRDERREKDRALDAQLRLDNQVRSFLSETLDSYNTVKQIRRMLEAENSEKPSPTMTIEAYSELLAQLSEKQLVFESLRRRAPLVQGRLPGAEAVVVEDSREDGKLTESLTRIYGLVEKYLNNVVDEYQTRRVKPAKGGSFDPSQLTNLKDFVYNTKIFRTQVSHRAEAAIRFLEEALLTPATRTADGAVKLLV